jgi:adenylate kinase family enzyme
VERDSLHHGPGWTTRPQFEDDVRRAVAGASWVGEWQYTAVREALLARADLLVWQDLPRRVVMARVVRRTVSRRIRRDVLWNGNAEPPLRTFLSDRDHILRWAWRTHAATAGRVSTARATRPDLVVVRLSTPAQVSVWVEGPLRASAYC